MAKPNRPESISGGCLCGAIRFTVNIPTDADWPLRANGVCQCTMCRKHSGSLLPQNVAVPLSHISPPLSSNPSYKTYASGKSTSRGFCSTCGSPLNFYDAQDPDFIEINLGVFDEEVLCGKRDEAVAWVDKHGRHVPRIGGWGYELAYPAYHIFTENEIPGVTDGFEGVKYLQDRKGVEGFRGKARELKRE